MEYFFTKALTYPPGFSKNSDLKTQIGKQIPQNILLLERVLCFDVLDLKWQNFRQIDEIKADLEQAGFSEVQVIFDKCDVFPAIIAKK